MFVKENPDRKKKENLHLLECEHFNYLLNLHSLPHSKDLVEYSEQVEFSVLDNTKIISNYQSWGSVFNKAVTSNGRKLTVEH